MNDRARILLFLSCGLLAGACGRDEPKASPPGTVASPVSAAAASASAVNPAAVPLDKAEQAAKQLGGAVRSRLVDAMNTGGPAKAVEVCSAEAQQIAVKVREETGVQVGRASLKLRNPADAGPPWVEEWLKAQGEKKAAEAEGLRAIVKTPEGAVARIIKPIAIEATCLTCHGDPASIKDDVKNILKEKYPSDKAMGYQIGDLRGALWAELKVPAGQ